MKENVIKLKTPLTDEQVSKLRIGDRVLLSGVIYTSRDAAHKRIVEAMDKGEKTPMEIAGQVIYYAGPSPTRPGNPIGSVGPTTSYRMDSYAPRLIEKGLKGMIGKGSRGKEVIEAMKKYKAVYFGATGGAAALIARVVKKGQVLAYPELGPEAVNRLEVEDFPLVVINDVTGADLYEEGVKKYQK